jgi:ribosomal protein S18 acetylase RimI-like enzyme
MALALAVRPALPSDRHTISSLIYFEPFVHRHLDWRAPLDWLGSNYYWILEGNGRAVASLCCAPDPAEIGWMRLFACSDDLRPGEAWSVLWPVAQQALQEIPATQAAAIVLQEWFSTLLSASGFAHSQDIVVLDRGVEVEPAAHTNPGITIRAMLPSDLPAVAEVDSAAFMPLWQNSVTTLERALGMAGIATVAESKDGLLAYQITTLHGGSGHLARLAVHPGAQRRKVAYALVRHMLIRAATQGLKRVTVNTQSDNSASLALYEQLGFHATGETYAVYVYPFH